MGLKEPSKWPIPCNAGHRLGGPVLAFAALSLSVPGWPQEPTTTLRINPFVRPALTASAPRPTDASGPVHSTAPPSNLRFALAAGPDSLVYVDGKTLRIGEEINGYRLEAVKADTAIFTNGEKVIELKIRLNDFTESE